jgi:glyoxylase-like metal-dependent hydrolase (beta-lactamase superfamily II)
VELPAELFLVDPEYTLPLAREVVRYASQLKKPITRLYVTHYHPGHLLGAATFGAPLLALDSVTEKLGIAHRRNSTLTPFWRATHTS